MQDEDQATHTHTSSFVQVKKESFELQPLQQKRKLSNESASNSHLSDRQLTTHYKSSPYKISSSGDTHNNSSSGLIHLIHDNGIIDVDMDEDTEDEASEQDE